MTFITSDFERSIGEPIGTVNLTLREALTRAGFEIATQSLTSIEGRRGSKFAMATVGAFALGKLPIRAAVKLQPAEGGCHVAIRLGDEWNPLFGSASAVKNSYREAFAEIQQVIDAALWQLTPAVSGEAAQESSRKKTGVWGDRLARKMDDAGRHAAKNGARVLAADWRTTKQPWDDVDEVRLQSSQGVAVVAMLEVQAMFNAGTLIATRPDSLPPPLLAELEQLQAHLEHALSGRSGSAMVPLGDSETTVLQFLRQQGSLRNTLPVRTLQDCVTCHTKKLVNPDYQKILRRNQMLKNIGGSFGAGIVKGSVSPFVLFNRVMSFAKLDPDFVCRNCQGLEAQESIVTLCPHCGATQPQAVLQECSKCGHDFRESLPHERLWSSASDGFDRPSPGTPAKWLGDPAGRHELRYWDGADWTAHVADDGQATTDTLVRTR